MYGEDVRAGGIIFHSDLKDINCMRQELPPMKKKIIKICILLSFIIIVSATAIYWLVPVRIYDDLNLTGKTIVSTHSTLLTSQFNQTYYSQETTEIIAKQLPILRGHRKIKWWWQKQISSCCGTTEEHLTVNYSDGTHTNWQFNIGKDGSICSVTGTRMGRSSWYDYKIYDYQELYDCLGIKEKR